MPTATSSVGITGWCPRTSMRSRRPRVSRRRVARTTSARAGSIRRSTASAMCGPSTCVKPAACAFTLGAGSARATTSSRPNRLSMRLPTRRARIRSPCDQPRAQAVIKASVEMSDFKRKRPGRGMGIAFSDYHGTLSAGVAEISLDRNTGKIKVHNYWVAVDPGLVIQPDHVHGQLESAVVFGLSAALLEELTVKGGAIQQSNFNDYPVLRMSDVPDIHTKIV